MEGRSGLRLGIFVSIHNFLIHLFMGVKSLSIDVLLLQLLHQHHNHLFPGAPPSILSVPQKIEEHCRFSDQ